MQTVIQSNKSILADLKQFLASVTPLREKITQLPRGPWQIKIQAGYDRSLFKNQKVAELDYTVEFLAIHEALDDFFEIEVKAADQLQASLKPLGTAIYNGSELSAAIIKQGISGLRDYQAVMKTHAAATSNFESALSQSLKDTRAEFNVYIKKQMAGQKEALNQYVGFESQIKKTVTQLTEIFTTEIPTKYDFGEKALLVALATV